MTYEELRPLIDNSQFAELQKLIDNGMAWKMKGSVGRAAMRALECGGCVLPNRPYYDYYGSRVPARQDLKEGTKGTLENSVAYYNSL